MSILSKKYSFFFLFIVGTSTAGSAIHADRDLLGLPAARAACPPPGGQRIAARPRASVSRVAAASVKTSVGFGQYY